MCSNTYWGVEDGAGVSSVRYIFDVPPLKTGAEIKISCLAQPDGPPS